jgi:outer membrane murein-binding lipoprotein Lpp
MDQARRGGRTEGEAGRPPEDWEQRLESSLRVVAGGLTKPAAKLTRDDELQHEALDLLARANQRIAAAEQKAVQLEAEYHQRETALTGQISELERRIDRAEQENARLETERATAEDRAERAEQRAEGTTQFLARLNDGLRDLAR